jgi:putative endonuclease
VRAKDGIGQYGERVAARHLTDAGLEIVERNWRCSFGELDLVARDGPVVVFAEVKTRSSEAFGDPAEAVDQVKAARLRRLAGLWLEAHGMDHAEVRFDVVSVLRARSGPAQVDHFRDVLT